MHSGCAGETADLKEPKNPCFPDSSQTQRPLACFSTGDRWPGAGHTWRGHGSRWRLEMTWEGRWSRTASERRQEAWLRCQAVAAKPGSQRNPWSTDAAPWADALATRAMCGGWSMPWPFFV
ncbi:hypothetical protein GQ53DRAFT_413144 [Thozetella sp. PMI_491]|nr:hypothetical protein GQ53DRAFT_413144 [Thozetella sp. PMI_491]